MNPVPPVSGTPPPRLGLAIASLILGIMAFLFSLFVVGLLFGLVGLVLGLVHIAGNRGPKVMAWWGTSLSLVGILTSIGLGIVYFRLAKDFVKSMAAMQTAAQTTPASDWEGVLAPDFTITTLDGKTIQLSELKGKRVVLDFWATWCGPCVQEIPHLMRLYQDTSRDQLVIVGISSETPAILHAFVKQKSIAYPIASAKALPDPYKDLPAIPTTFFIDRNGVIQSVVVGYHDLNQLRPLALAPDFQGQAKTKPEPAASGLKEAEKMLTPVEIWSNSIPGAEAICAADWDGDGRTDVLVADAGKKLHVFGADGREKSTLSLPEAFTRIECGRNKQRGVQLLGYNRWQRKISVMDATGKERWHYSAMFGVNGAHWGDLDGDGTDEMIVGMNGFGGLHAVSADGKRLWRVAGGNFWGQAVVPATQQTKATILATDATGSIRLFDGTGAPLRTLRPRGKYCTQLAAAIVDKENTLQGVALAQDEIVGFDATGHVTWSTALAPNPAGWVDVSIASGRTEQNTVVWAVVDAAGDLVLVNAGGEKIAEVSGVPGATGFVILSDASGRGEVVILSSGTLTGYSLQ